MNDLNSTENFKENECLNKVTEEILYMVISSRFSSCEMTSYGVIASHSTALSHPLIENLKFSKAFVINERCLKSKMNLIDSIQPTNEKFFINFLYRDSSYEVEFNKRGIKKQFETTIYLKILGQLKEINQSSGDLKVVSTRAERLIYCGLDSDYSAPIKGTTEFLYFYNGLAVGKISCMLIKKTTAYCTRLYIDPKYRGLGLSHELRAKTYHWAQRNGALYSIGIPNKQSNKLNLMEKANFIPYEKMAVYCN